MCCLSFLFLLVWRWLAHLGISFTEIRDDLEATFCDNDLLLGGWLCVFKAHGIALARRFHAQLLHLLSWLLREQLRNRAAGRKEEESEHSDSLGDVEQQQREQLTLRACWLDDA